MRIWYGVRDFQDAVLVSMAAGCSAYAAVALIFWLRDRLRGRGR